jgi:hypothetical protein
MKLPRRIEEYFLKYSRPTNLKEVYITITIDNPDSKAGLVS